MSGSDPATLLRRPIWYEPLRSPAWLLPGLRDDAPIVTIEPTGGGVDEADREADELRVGLALFLADGIRFMTEARTVVALAPPEDPTIHVTVGTRDDPTGPELAADLRGPDGSDLGTVSERHAGDDRSLGEAIGMFPSSVVAALRQAGVRSVWSTVFQAPDAGHAAEHVRGYAVCRALLVRSAQRDDGETPDAAAARHAWAESALRRLAALAGRTPNHFAALLFFAGLAAAHRAGIPAYLGQRLAANAVCMNATDPRDPVFRISVLVFHLLGDHGIAEQRSRALAAGDDEHLRRWLAGVADVRPIG